MSLLATSPSVATLCKAGSSNCEGLLIGKVSAELEKPEPNWDAIFKAYSTSWIEDATTETYIGIDPSADNIGRLEEILEYTTQREMDVAVILMSRTPCSFQLLPHVNSEETERVMEVLAKSVKWLEKNRINHHVIQYEDMLHNPCTVARELLAFIPQLLSLSPSKAGLDGRYWGIARQPPAKSALLLARERAAEATWHPGSSITPRLATILDILGHGSSLKCTHGTQQRLWGIVPQNNWTKRRPELSDILNSPSQTSGNLVPSMPATPTQARSRDEQTTLGTIIVDFVGKEALTDRTVAISQILKVSHQLRADIILSSRPCDALDPMRNGGREVNCSIPWRRYWGEHAPEYAEYAQTQAVDIDTNDSGNVMTDYVRMLSLRLESKNVIWRLSAKFEGAFAKEFGKLANPNTRPSRQWIEYPQWAIDDADRFISNHGLSGGFDLLKVGRIDSLIMKVDSPHFCDTEAHVVSQYQICTRKSIAPRSQKKLVLFSDALDFNWIESVMGSIEGVAHVDAEVRIMLSGADNYQIFLVGHLLLSKASNVYMRSKWQCMACSNTCDVILSNPWSSEPIKICGAL